MRLRIDSIINNSKLKKLISGFSLIELMVVVAIIGILASMAVPAYDGYMVRSRLTHLINIAKDAKSAISENRVVQGTFPNNVKEVYNIPVDEYYDNANIENGFPTGCNGANKTQLKYLFNIPGNGKVFPEREPIIYMTGTWTSSTASQAAALNWTCEIYFSRGNTEVSPKYVPAGCKQITNPLSPQMECT